MTGGASSARGLAALRRLVSSAPAQERCELCAAELSAEHQHLVDPELRRLLCACDACAILFDHSGVTRYRRVPRDIRLLADFEIPGPLWNTLAIPIGLVFFFRSSVSKSALAVYPSPGGPAEVRIEPEDWDAVAALHPSIGALAEDVEAVLINRMAGARDYCIVPIDECYRLAGIIRREWKGMTGGDELWDAVGSFLNGLKRRGWPARSASYA